MRLVSALGTCAKFAGEGSTHGRFLADASLSSILLTVLGPRKFISKCTIDVIGFLAFYLLL